MLLYRIAPAKFATHAWNGEGARRHGARWNHRGLRVVYASPSLSLAAIEFFVNLEPSLALVPLVSCCASLPDDLPVAQLDLASLPPDWTQSSSALRALGDDWIRTASTVALRVPSAAIPGEWNLLLNPAHPDFSRLNWRQLGGALSASGRTLPRIEARTPSDQRERPGQKVASHLLPSRPFRFDPRMFAHHRS